jgi:hypothetical protein
MAEDTQKKPRRGYVSSYLKLPLRPLDQAQQEQEAQQAADLPPEQPKKSKD